MSKKTFALVILPVAGTVPLFGDGSPCSGTSTSCLFLGLLELLVSPTWLPAPRKRGAVRVENIAPSYVAAARKLDVLFCVSPTWSSS